MLTASTVATNVLIRVATSERPSSGVGPETSSSSFMHDVQQHRSTSLCDASLQALRHAVEKQERELRAEEGAARLRVLERGLEEKVRELRHHRDQCSTIVTGAAPS